MKRNRTGPSALMVFIAGCSISAPGSAFAQAAFRVLPSFSMSQVYDSNLWFAAENPEADFITRVTPGIESRYDSPVVTFAGRYTLDIERFLEHPEFSAMDGHRGSVMFRKRTPRAEFGADAAFTRTRVPGELNTDTGLVLARALAERFLVHPSVGGQLDRLTSGTIDYSFTQDQLAGGARLRAHTAAIQIERRPSERDTTTLAYTIQRYDFDHALGTAFAAEFLSTSQALTAGWQRELTRETSIALRGGPRLTDGHLAPDFAASVVEHLKAVALSVGYARAVTTLIGIVGTAATESVNADATFRPRRGLELRVAPGVYRIVQDGRQTRAYRVSFGTSARITSTLSIVAAYDVNLQQGNIYTTRFGRSIPRHVLSIGFVRAAERAVR